MPFRANAETTMFLASSCSFWVAINVHSDYTSNTFKENKIDVLTKTMVKEVKEKTIVAQDENKNLIECVIDRFSHASETALPFTV